jgi:hypothetical protein
MMQRPSAGGVEWFAFIFGLLAGLGVGLLLTSQEGNTPERYPPYCDERRVLSAEGCAPFIYERQETP